MTTTEIIFVLIVAGLVYIIYLKTRETSDWTIDVDEIERREKMK